MSGGRTWLLAAMVAVVGLGCGSDAGTSKGTGGAGGGGGRSGSGGVAGGTGGAGGDAGSKGGAGSGGGGAGSGGGGAASGGGAGVGTGGAGVGGHSAGGGGGSTSASGGHAGGGAGNLGHAGAGGATGGAGGAGKLCGGLAGVRCNDAILEFCNFGDGSCGAGDKQGHCELAGGALCQQVVVCGCDGKTYASACQAHANGVDTTNKTSCIAGNGGDGANCGADQDCMSGYKCCVTGGRVGSPIACRQVAAGAACPALP